jgi:hypothetical protein
MIAYRTIWKLVLLSVLILAACAPEDLDITPIPLVKVYVTGEVNEPGKTLDLPQGSRVQDAIEAAGGATENADLTRINLVRTLQDGDQVNVPAIGVVEPTPDASASQEADPKAFLEKLVEITPQNMTGGSINWRRNPASPPTYSSPRGGDTVLIIYTESAGGELQLTYGIFPTGEAATGYYDAIVKALQDQTRTSERSEFPTPNQFGAGGTYGSAGIFLLDSIVVRIAIPRFNTASGVDPVTPLVEPILGYIEEAKGA